MMNAFLHSVLEIFVLPQFDGLIKLCSELQFTGMDTEIGLLDGSNLQWKIHLFLSFQSIFVRRTFGKVVSISLYNLRKYSSNNYTYRRFETLD